MQESILLPVAALAIWTMIVLALIPITRGRAVVSGGVKPEDFTYGESGKILAQISIPNRAYMNLLELPVLFYVLCLALYTTKQVDGLHVTMAWVFVGSRLVHSLVHLTYNNVIHRGAVFGVGVVVLLAMWVRFGWGLV